MGVAQLSELDKRFTGGIGSTVVAHGKDIAEQVCTLVRVCSARAGGVICAFCVVVACLQGLEFLGDRYRTVKGGPAAALGATVTSASTADEVLTESETTVAGVVPESLAAPAAADKPPQ